MTWVVSDFTATSPQELSVSKGQQVEVVEICSSKPDFCLVRMPTRGTDHDLAGVPEGLVPLSALKQPPQLRSSPRRHPTEHDVGKWCCELDVTAISVNPNGYNYKVKL